MAVLMVRLYFEGAGCDIVEKKETLRIQSFYKAT